MVSSPNNVAVWRNQEATSNLKCIAQPHHASFQFFKLFTLHPRTRERQHVPSPMQHDHRAKLPFQAEF